MEIALKDLQIDNESDDLIIVGNFEKIFRLSDLLNLCNKEDLTKIALIVQDRLNKINA